MTRSSRRRRNAVQPQSIQVKTESLESRTLLTNQLMPIDGIGNNVENPEWGSAGIPLVRMTASDYADHVSELSRDKAASPREISNLVNAQEGSIPNDRMMTDFVWQWGQFLDHDIDLTPEAEPVESAAIKVPRGDVFFDPRGTGTATIGLSRSVYDGVSGSSVILPRQQENEITAFVDGSNVYGSDSVRAAALRTFSGGKLRTSDGNLLPFNTDGLPNAGGTGSNLFLAGDVRANEQVGLVSMHTLFVREHNWWTDRLADEHPEWNDEQLYQAARQRVVAELQVISYQEFLPTLLGDEAIPEYTGYRADVDPGIGNIFSTASYRFGHSMLSPQLLQLDEYGEPIDSGHLALRDAFFRPDYVIRQGIDSTLRGLAAQLAQEVDTHIVDDVRNFLFGPPGSGGFDLASLNIQRGRDHGLPDYNSVRLAYGLEPVTSFSEITTSTDLQLALEMAYGHVNQIDPWIGGLAEDHRPDSSMGELLTTVLVDQFVRLRDGDRFWYENVLDTESIAEVESTTLADIIRRNTAIQNIQDNVFLRADAAVDDHGDSPHAASALIPGVAAGGDIEQVYDRDWFTLHVDAGATYAFEIELVSHRDSWLTLYDSDGSTLLAENDDYYGRASYLEWTAGSSGQIFVVVSGYGTQTGTYVLDAAQIDDYPDSPEWLPVSRAAGKFSGQLESPGDVDLIPITVEPGTTYSLNVSSHLSVDILDASGLTTYARITTDYALDSVLWSAGDHTDYILKVRSANSSLTGDYKISIREASFGPGNLAPVIDPVPDQSAMYHDRRLLIPYRATDSEGGWMWINVEAVCDGEAYQTVSRLQLKPGSSDWYNWGGRQEKWIGSETGEWYFILPDGSLYRWNRSRGAHGDHMADLSAIYHAELGRLFDLRLVNPPRLTITDAFIQVDLPTSYVGEFTVVLRVADGQVETEKLIRVTATPNRAPVFTEVPDLLLIDGEDALIHVPATDPDMDPLSYDVRVRHLAYELDQQWNFHSDGDLHENWGGLGEKWFKGSGSNWYFLTDEGNLYRWNRSGKAGGDHIATLDSIYHRDIDRLLDAVPPQQLASARFEGGMLRIDPQAGAIGMVDVVIGADDGEYRTEASMTVRLASRNTAPTIAPIDDLELLGGNQSVIDLVLNDAEGGVLSTTAEVQHFSIAAKLSRDLGLIQSSKSFENWGGKGEKWIQGAGKSWYYITPDGSLYRWTASTGMNGALIAELDSAYHADLSLFFRAESDWPPVDLDIVGTSLRVRGKEDFRGFVFVKVTVEDEMQAAATTVFRVWIR